MFARQPVARDPFALTYAIDYSARGVLREDRAYLWSANQHGLSNLASSEVLEPSVFDRLPTINKHIVVGRVAHVVEELQAHYRREIPPTGTKAWHFINYPVLYIRTDDLWQQILALAYADGVNGGTATHAAAEQLSNLLDSAADGGDLVRGQALEQCLEHGRSFLLPVEQTGSLSPVLDESNLDADDIHAFLCAYETTFHR